MRFWKEDRMPWDEAPRMELRARFIGDLDSCLYTMTELCEQYGISRKTGYKWAQRYAKEGRAGLEDRSRAPKSCRHRTPEEISEALLALRRKYPTWGPRKLLAWLWKREPEVSWPAASTVGDLLKRQGLVPGRRASARRWPHPGRPSMEASAPNQLWTSDFKGQFRTGDGVLCYPLTVADGFSRFLLGVEGLDSVAESTAWVVFERLFREHGLPEVIRTDNGSPFASGTAVGGLSRLSVRWIKLGIRPERILPGHPEQNGAHERMHRTLKAETARPPAASRPAQQERFERFRRLYNEERPHEALSQRPPGDLYRPSSRAYPSRLPEPEYPGHFEVRRVRGSGEIKWQGGYLFVSQTLDGERVGLEETDDGVWSMYFGPVLLARFDAREKQWCG
jgi:transposase InsO family protein